MTRGGLAALALLILLKVATAPAQADLIWGVNGHPFTAYPGIGFKQQLDYVEDLGMSSYRVNVSSITHAPALRRLVDLASPRGIDILPVLTPGLDLDNSSPEQLYKWAHAFAVYLVSRFKDDIRVWELGNELENYAIIQPCETRDNGEPYNCEWGPAGGVSPLDYFGPRWAKASAVLKGLSDGTTSVDPKIRKAIGTAGWGHVGAFERMRQDGIEWDISVWHMYGEDPEWAFKKLAEYGKPIWVTEFNHPSGSQHGVVDQAKGLKRWMQRLRELEDAYNVEAAHIYELLDETYWAPGFESVMGLVYLEKDERNAWRIAGNKPAYCVVKTLLRGGYRMPVSGPQSEGTADRPQPAALPQRACNLCLFDHRDAGARNKVRYSYCLILGREADGGGVQSWASALDSGRTMRSILLGMLQSDEFKAGRRTSELGASGYVALLYRLLLDREPDSQGLADYAKALEQGASDRGEVARSIMGSPEFRRKHKLLFREDAQRQSGRVGANE